MIAKLFFGCSIVFLLLGFLIGSLQKKVVMGCPEGQVMLKADGKDACFTPGVYYANSTVISK